MRSEASDLVERYLRELEAELRDVPRGRRKELVEEIRAHIAEASAELPDPSPAQIRTILDRIGDPAAIAAEARDRVPPAPRGTRLEIAALIFLLPGSLFMPFVGWLI